jgi:hypothetical protein
MEGALVESIEGTGVAAGERVVPLKLFGYMYACTVLVSRVTPSVWDIRGPVEAPVFTAIPA